jgi:hypothetical protein
MVPDKFHRSIRGNVILVEVGPISGLAPRHLAYQHSVNYILHKDVQKTKNL